MPTLASVYGVKLVADGVLRRSLTAVCVAAVLIAVVRELTWPLGGLHVSLSMKMQEKASQLLNAHLVALTASIPTIEQHERPAISRSSTGCANRDSHSVL